MKNFKFSAQNLFKNAFYGSNFCYLYLKNMLF